MSFRKHNCLTMHEALIKARSLADALSFCQSGAIFPECMVLHRDLKPDNIAFTFEGGLKLIDFGLACIIEGSSPFSDDLYEMTGAIGSLRYMAVEVAKSEPYNHKADVYSFGILLWEMLSCTKSFNGLGLASFHEQVMIGGKRPFINKKWPKLLIDLMTSCWSVHIDERPTFQKILSILDQVYISELGHKKKFDMKSARKTSIGRRSLPIISKYVPNLVTRYSSFSQASEDS